MELFRGGWRRCSVDGTSRGLPLPDGPDLERPTGHVGVGPRSRENHDHSAWRGGRSGAVRAEGKPRPTPQLGRKLEKRPGQSSLGLTECPPNWLRRAATAFIAGESSCLEAKRANSAAVIAGVGTALLMDSSTVHLPSPESVT